MSTITAYDFTSRRKNVPMVPSSIKVYKYEGVNRYRVAGLSKEGHRLSKFVGEDEAKQLAKKYGGFHRAKSRK